MAELAKYKTEDQVQHLKLGLASHIYIYKSHDNLDQFYTIHFIHFAQHPKVCGHHEVGCDGVDNSAQDEGVLDVVENYVQHQPRDIVEAH